MTIYVEKELAHGPIRFGVSPRKPVEQVDDDASLSTGPSGEFLGRELQGLFFADIRAIDAPSLPTTPSITTTSFWSSMRPRDARGWGFLALMIAGVVLVLLGFAVIINTLRWQGWIEVILGAAMIATPIVLTAKERRDKRLQEENERAEREERERRHREMLASYTNALAELRKNPTDAALQAASRERQRLELPYALWAPLARRTVLHIGFAGLTPERASEVAQLMDRAATAVGLSQADGHDVKVDLYRVIAWHLLAADRVGEGRAEQLAALRRAFSISEDETAAERQAIEQFRMLRGVTTSNLPREQASIPLQFRESCIHSARGAVITKNAEAATVFLTNKRVIIEGRKRIEIPLTQIDDVEVNIDKNTLTIRVARPARPVVLQVEQPIYTAALIDLATAIDERPRGFA